MRKILLEKKKKKKLKDPATGTNRRIIALAKNSLFKSSDAISAGIFTEISATTIRPQFVQLNLPGKTCWKVFTNGKTPIVMDVNITPGRKKYHYGKIYIHT